MKTTKAPRMLRGMEGATEDTALEATFPDAVLLLMTLDVSLMMPHIKVEVYDDSSTLIVDQKVLSVHASFRSTIHNAASFAPCGELFHNVSEAHLSHVKHHPPSPIYFVAAGKIHSTRNAELDQSSAVA
ncbi:hypothetical protein TOPH_09203 [Tolypocladium ophioglossoides CBS 100239]|uniref:Uncharacterized protein n=1 Tax=Tolypocladium ophioglossoides (strain CBS 100239) TaxID=1163406 RepID=A0A0L0MWC4_TOLOC|nr:hypothetical protein TOPH_09203 [Tolypocladium ophioglossoides CBS 100239]